MGTSTGFIGRVEHHPELAIELEQLAERLAGDALVRFSGALGKHEPRLADVLGCAVRFRHEATAEPSADDRDLLFATVASRTTNVEDYLANEYYAVSPFDVGAAHALYFRLRPERPSRHVIGDREARIEDAVARDDAAIEIDVSASPSGPWSPIVRLVLLHATHVDRETIPFRPYRAGRGVEPRGLAHALRRAAGAMSQWARPRTVP